MSVFRDRVVAVTGAGGSIGMQLCRQALQDGAQSLVMISLTEGGLYEANRRLRAEFPQARLKPVLGSYGNRALMMETLRGVELIAHAGAHKHVPICEDNPLEAIANNVLGTFNLLQVATDYLIDVERVVVVSSDKAVQPASIMGMTKRVVEKLAAEYGRRHSVCAVRFGNVLDSAGSVLPLWREQIAAGGPLTLTDEGCERYFMAIPDAVRLIRYALEFGVDGRIYVLEMGERVRMLDVARDLIAKSGKDVQIQVTGLRPGEKLIEELSHGEPLLSVGSGISMVTGKVPRLEAEDMRDLEYAYRKYDRREAVQILKRMAS